jgi:hypothetical protein
LSLLFWIFTDKKNDDNFFETALYIQFGVFTIMFFFLESVSIHVAMKKIEERLGIKAEEPESLTKLPSIKDIGLIFLAVGLGVLLTYIIISSEVNMDSLSYYIGIIGLILIWAIHNFASYFEFTSKSE